MTPYKATASHYSSLTEEDGVLCSFDSMDELMNVLVSQVDVFTAISLAKEINEMNGYNIIGEFQMKELKSHYRNENTKIKSENTKGNQNRFPKKQNVENRLLKNQTSVSTKLFTSDDIISNENVKIEKENTRIKMRELQKGYMQLLSN